MFIAELLRFQNWYKQNIHQLMMEKNAVYSYYEILFSHKKEQDSNTYNDIENL